MKKEVNGLEKLMEMKKEVDEMKKGVLMIFEDIVNECTTKRELIMIIEMLKNNGWIDNN